MSRLLKKRVITPEGCWVIPKVKAKDCYPRIRYYGTLWKAANLVFYLKRKSEWSPSLYICHKCNNKKCFNPEHLYLGTNSENLLDFHRPSRGANR